MGTRVIKFCKHPKLLGLRDNQSQGEIHRNRTPRNIDAKPKKVRVRFLLPENTNVDHKKEIEVFPDNSDNDESPTLPAICELMIFSNQRMETPTRSSSTKQKTVLPKQPLPTKTNEDCTHRKRSTPSTVVRLPPAATPKCSTKELKMSNNNNCMLPEDYKDPSHNDTRRRILAWLDDAERAKPSYRRRYNTFST